MKTLKDAAAKFSAEEKGAQAVEYALIIGVLSIALALVLGNRATGIAGKFPAFVTRVGNVLSTGTGNNNNGSGNNGSGNNGSGNGSGNNGSGNGSGNNGSGNGSGNNGSGNNNN